MMRFWKLVNIYNYDVNQTANALDTDSNLVGIKIESMNHRGYKFKSDIQFKNNFLLTALFIFLFIYNILFNFEYNNCTDICT